MAQPSKQREGKKNKTARVRIIDLHANTKKVKEPTRSWLPDRKEKDKVKK